MRLEHEEVLVRRGPRSGLPIVVAVHSTALGQAVGGLRMWHYPDWRDAQSDALRLSRGMTYKCALAGVDKGGGKTVVALPDAVTPELRHAALLDAGDVIDSLGGRYAYVPETNRAVAVHGEGLLQALEHVYGAGRLVKELRAHQR